MRVARRTLSLLPTPRTLLQPLQTAPLSSSSTPTTTTAPNYHGSDAEARIEATPVIEIEGDLAICDGGGGATGHPVEYIALPPDGKPRSCLYCGLRYAHKVHHDHIDWPDWGDYRKRA